MRGGLLDIRRKFVLRQLIQCRKSTVAFNSSLEMGLLNQPTMVFVYLREPLSEASTIIAT